MTPAIAIALAATITGTAPAWKADGCCCADTTRPSRVRAAILKRSATPKAHGTRGKRGAK